MINLEEVTFCYQKNTPIFQRFSLNLNGGHIWTMIAPSGYGKTTLLYLIAGLYKPESGKILVNNKLLTGPRRSTGLILQDFGLLPWATAFENVALGLKIRRVDAKKTKSVASRWLSSLNIESFAHRYPAELSGGQRQRVAIARTLALEPDLLLMDEPFASLDALTRESLQNLIASLHRDIQIGTTILVTHNIEEAVFLGRKILVLSQLPNNNVVVVDNPDSGTADFRDSCRFNEVCGQLRKLMDAALDTKSQRNSAIKAVAS
jgi:NitT/TauT family transport system ATP-binding protein